MTTYTSFQFLGTVFEQSRRQKIVHLFQFFFLIHLIIIKVVHTNCLKHFSSKNLQSMSKGYYEGQKSKRPNIYHTGCIRRRYWNNWRSCLVAEQLNWPFFHFTLYLLIHITDEFSFYWRTREFKLAITGGLLIQRVR